MWEIVNMLLNDDLCAFMRVCTHCVTLANDALHGLAHVTHCVQITWLYTGRLLFREWNSDTHSQILTTPCMRVKVPLLYTHTIKCFHKKIYFTFS